VKTFIYPYKKGSKSAKALAQALGIKQIKREGSKFKPAGKRVINWGCSRLPANIEGNAVVLNDSLCVETAANKFLTLCCLKDAKIPAPVFYTQKDNAQLHMELDHKSKIFCRTTLTGNSGAGIVIASTVDELVPAPLYTVWERIANEYRIHVFNGKVIDRQRKARSRDVPDDQVNWKVRNLAGGFIFARGDCQPEDGIEDAAVRAVAALGLDFGAVDVVWTKAGRVMVLEVNTACGLMGTTLEKYVEAFSG